MAASSAPLANESRWQEEMADALFQVLLSKRTGSCGKRVVTAEHAIELHVYARASKGLNVIITVLDDSCHICFGSYAIRIERRYNAKDNKLITETAQLMSKLLTSRIRLRRQRRLGIFDTYVIEADQGTGWQRLYTGSTFALRVPTETITLENWF